jgi:tripartite ATP-independent transporter DctM subunit
MKNSSPDATLSKGAKIGLGLGGGFVAFVAIAGGLVAGTVVLLALLGMPLFAVMGGSAELLWLSHSNAAYHHLRFVPPAVLEERFANNPATITIPLFTFIGYVLAESKTPDRLVAAARSIVGWMPGGLAIVCILASAAFTVLTGGSGVTIIAVGGLLYSTLRKQGYSEAFSLGLITTGGSVGLVLPLSMPLAIYAIWARINIIEMFKAVLIPGLLVLVLLSAYSAYVGAREGVRRERPELRKIAGALWELKWELGIPILVFAGIFTGLTSLDEAAGLAALYVVIIEFFVYRDLSLRKDFVRITKASVSLAGGIILMIAMASALINYVVEQHVPAKVLALMLRMGIEHRWQFLVTMNVFLLLLGMLMEEFSAILITVPLMLPIVADFGHRHVDEKMSPYQLAAILVLNLEIAYCMPPLGLNLFISSFRFNRAVSTLYKRVMPFVGILAIGLMLVSYVPWFSTVAVTKDVAAVRAKAQRDGIPPRDAWNMECVQVDPINPQPCSAADMAKFPGGQMPTTQAGQGSTEPSDEGSQAPDAGCNPDFEDCAGK